MPDKGIKKMGPLVEGPPSLKRGNSKIKMGRHFAKISRAPLKSQDSSDAWNERSRRLASGYDAAKLLATGIIERNKARHAIIEAGKKRELNGSRPSE